MKFRYDIKDIHIILVLVMYVLLSYLTIIYGAKQEDISFSKIGDQSAEPTVVIWGSAFSSKTAQDLAEVLIDDDKSAYIADYEECPSVLGEVVTRCSLRNERIYKKIVSMKAIDSVLLISRWPVYFKADKNVTASYVLFDDEDPKKKLVKYTNGVVKVACGLKEQGKEVYVFATVPELTEKVPANFSEYRYLCNKEKDTRLRIINHNRYSKNKSTKGCNAGE